MSDFILNILLIAILTISSASYGYQVGKRKSKRMQVSPSEAKEQGK